MTDANCPMDRAAVIDRYFLEHRAKLIDLAAFLDRVDRSGDGTVDDFRITAFRKAIEELVLENDYDMILPRGAALYVGDLYDVTRKVTEKLNEMNSSQ